MTGIVKNTPFSTFQFVMTSGNPPVPTTGLTVTGQVCLDGNFPQALTNAVTEVALGVYKVNFSAVDTNANSMMLIFTAPGANSLYLEVLTS